MSTSRDLPCMISGVSLLDAECGAVLLRLRQNGQWTPVSLPFFGSYRGRGTLEEVDEGPGATLLLGAFRRLLSSGVLRIDVARLGVSQPEVEHPEVLFNLLALSEIHAPGAIQLGGRPLSFCLFSAHVAACLMEGSPAWIDSVMLEDVPNRVLGAESSFYDELPSLPLRLRCKFGLSFASLASLMEEMKRRSIDFSPPPLSARPTADEADALLKAALQRAVGDELLLSGISDYMTGLEEAQAN